jgi:hydrogenase nickel incorporation protein HypB
MCATCGCGEADVRVHGEASLENDGDNENEGRAAEVHDPHFLLRPPYRQRPETARLIHVEQELLAKNDALAARNRRWLSERQVLAYNLLSAPGAGKTSLLERTTRDLSPAPISILEGDQETTRDADRVRAAGARAVQINTGRGCHLDASMVGQGLSALGPAHGSLLFIENVGNLVCPSLFDLGERAKVVLLSVTEGEDKPLKYPHAFRSASVLVITKIDLLAHVPFDLHRCLHYAHHINPQLLVFCLSAHRGDGMAAWCDWLRAGLDATTWRPAPGLQRLAGQRGD